MYPAFKTTELPSLNSEGIVKVKVPSSEEAEPTFSPKTDTLAYGNAFPSVLVTLPDTCILPQA